MKTNIIEKSQWGRELEIEVPAERIDKELNKAYRDYQKRLELPGFRRGKVPRKVKPAANEAYARVESARGELGVYVIADGTDKPYRARYRTGTDLYPGELGMLNDVRFILTEQATVAHHRQAALDEGQGGLGPALLDTLLVVVAREADELLAQLPLIH